MRISDWSSDVCPSDLALRFDHQLELLVVEPHIEQSIRGIARADALLSGALMHGSARQRCYGAAQLLQQFAFLKLKNSHIRPRSEEHTSELQSLMRISSAVFCLKTKHNSHKHISYTITQ